MKKIEKVELPQHIMEEMLEVLNREREYIGEKPIDNGFIVKRNKNKATITLDRNGKVYSAKMIYSDLKWNVIGSASIWANIKDITSL